MGFFTNAPTSVGTVQDMAGRLRSTLPLGWFPTSSSNAASNSPILDGVLAGIATAWSFCFGLLGATSQQTRLDTASGAFLDLISQDYFGAELPREPGESDPTFRARIVAGFKIQRGTREDVEAAVASVAGVTPFICEPRRGLDCGGLGGASAIGAGGGFGYGCVALRYGSNALAFQYLLTVPAIATFAPGYVCIRRSHATFIDALGAMRLVAPDVLRPAFNAGSVSGALIEGRACNLIADSLHWRGFASSIGSSGAAVLWQPVDSTASLFALRPVLSISMQTGAAVSGPSVMVACGGSLVTCSVWIMIEQLGGLSAVDLVAVDLGPAGTTSTIGAPLLSVGVWQRLVTSLQVQPNAGRNLRLGLSLSSSGASPATVLTQCWQVEVGSAASSYIPTNGTVSFREADTLLPASGSATAVPVDVGKLFAAIASCIPVATIAWSNAAPSVQV